MLIGTRFLRQPLTSYDSLSQLAEQLEQFIDFYEKTSGVNMPFAFLSYGSLTEFCLTFEADSLSLVGHARSPVNMWIILTTIFTNFEWSAFESSFYTARKRLTLLTHMWQHRLLLRQLILLQVFSFAKISDDNAPNGMI